MQGMEGEGITQAWTEENPTFPISFPHLTTVVIEKMVVSDPKILKFLFSNLTMP